MIEVIQQVQSAPIAQLKLTHFVGLMTFTRDEFHGEFTLDNPAPGKLATEMDEYDASYDVLDGAYHAESYSLLTEKLKEADTACDTIFMGIKRMVQGQQSFTFNTSVKDAADLVMQSIDKYDINTAEDYLGENNKLQQWIHDLESTQELTAAATLLGLDAAVAELKVQVTLVRTLLTQRGEKMTPKGTMKAARSDMEDRYRWLIYCLNAYAIVDSHPERFYTLIDHLNKNIQYLKDHVLSRGGKQDEGGDEPEPEPEPEPQPEPQPEPEPEPEPDPEPEPTPVTPE